MVLVCCLRFLKGVMRCIFGSDPDLAFAPVPHLAGRKTQPAGTRSPISVESGLSMEGPDGLGRTLTGGLNKSLGQSNEQIELLFFALLAFPGVHLIMHGLDPN